MAAIRGYSAAQLRAAEAPHLAAGEPLMRMAAAALADEIRRLLDVQPSRVLLLIGSGNNGGDALYAGAELAAEGIEVWILPTGPRMHEEALAAATGAGARIAQKTDTLRLAREADVIVDGILGTGTSADPALRGEAREIVAAILPVLAEQIVVAVDIPSGIGPDDGSVPDPIVLPADVTVTFGGYKAGLLLPPAAALAGRVRLVDIGLEADLAGLEPLVTVAEPAD
ncbi:MAG TPA: NAD(P)H-hydrate epimerase [Lacisediminihabitans sp.]|uniref:NAD(P)H-hydrate epimerase n=1 Tax=Lacisediminihabitans sp. TaxID=2787631 RepID=UPI002EDACFB3